MTRIRLHLEKKQTRNPHYEGRMYEEEEEEEEDGRMGGRDGGPKETPTASLLSSSPT